MKRLLLTLTLVIAMSTTAFAATQIMDWGTVLSDYPGSTTGNAGDSAGGVVWTRHNLSSYGEHYQATTSVDGSNNAQTVVTTEVCVFCHTPHFGKTDSSPLWNRGTSATGYVAYGASEQTLAGTSTSVGGSSLACLSCHDGVTTLDNLINKPGKGSRTDGTGADQGWVFGEIGTDTIGGTGASRLNIGAANDGVRNAAAVDLSNDHPIGVVYYGDPTGVKLASLRPLDTVISSINIYNAKEIGGTGGSAYGRSDNLWAVKGYIREGDATINDLLKEGNMVQCASCHDPHYKNQTNDDPSLLASYATTDQNDGEIDGLFLRRVGGNSNSGVCRTCHNK